jgi:hypothetical protein
MESKSTLKKTEMDRELEEFMKQNKDILYKRTSEDIGKRQDEGGKQDKKVSDGAFTKVYRYIINSISLAQGCIDFMV